MNRGGLYGGWIVVDVRLATFVVLLCAASAALLLTLLVRRRPWHEYATLFLALWTGMVGLGFLLLQTILNYPVLVERDFFPLK